MNIFVIRTLIIILAIITGYVIYTYLISPFILEPMCLVNSNGCVRMNYYSYNNSALIEMKGSGIWIWFNGEEAFVYGQPVGQICQNPNKYVAAYAVDPRTGLKKGYKCVITLDQVIDFYKKNKVKNSHIVKRVKNPNNFNLFDVLNLFQELNIIDLSK